MRNLSPLCAYAQGCGGCSQIDLPYAEQKRRKLERLSQALLAIDQNLPHSAVSILSAGPSKVRDKVDFAVQQTNGEQRIGYFARGGRDLLDVAQCPLMSEPLLSCYQAFRQDPPPISKAAVRLRISPSGQWGIWLDCSNEEIKQLLDQGEWLHRASRRNLVELGQKRKRAQLEGGQWKLKKTEFFPWFETYGPEHRGIPLKSAIGTFTQVGFAVNRLLVDSVCAHFEDFSRKTILELGSGIGNFTLALGARGVQVVACEWDVLAVKALAENVSGAKMEKSIEIKRTNIYRDLPSLNIWLGQVDGLLVDPPRSGLGVFADHLSQNGSNRLGRIVYVSCFLETLCHDLSKLVAHGYQLKEAQVVDQFPHTEHGEYVVLLTRS